MKHKIYLSIPITGKEDTFFERLTKAKKCIERNIKFDYDLITPEDINKLTENNIKEGETEYDYATYIGMDIKEFLYCDTSFFAKGWMESKGCQLEYAAAKIYGHKIFFEDDFEYESPKIKIKLFSKGYYGDDEGRAE